MKNILITLQIMLFTFSLNAQNYSGHWAGALTIQNKKVRIIFNIKQTKTGYVSTMDSPDQGAKGIAVNSTVFNDSLVEMTIKSIG